MSNKFLLKKSSVASKVPLTTDLDYGEIALNYADGKIYFKNASNVIKSFTIDDSVVTLAGTQTLTNKTLTSPTINGGALSGTFSGAITLSDTTASTSTTTGALKIGGGLGVAGTIYADQIRLTNNGSGTNVYLGDDVILGDINQANTLGIRGNQDSTQGYLVFGSSNSTAYIGRNGTNPITVTGQFSVNSGTVTGNDAISLQISGYANKGGTGYHDFLKVTNSYSSATNPSKYFRLNDSGNLEIINSAYSANIFTLTDAGVLSVPAISAGGSTGTSGQVLASTGTGLQWLSVGGTGTVTSVGLSLPSIFTVSGSPVTTAGTLSATLASQTANTVLAAPNGIAGTPSFRSLVAADIPTLNQNTTGSAGSVANALTIGTGLSGTSYNGSSAVTIAIDSTVTTLTGTQTLTNKTLTSPTINGGTITVQDASFILQDNADATKQAKFELSGLPTATTVTYTLPTGSGGASTLIDASTTQNITGQKVFNAATVTFGNATTTGTYGLGNGATTSGNTRTIQIGNAGLAGSTTAITIGGTANTTTVAANGTWTFNTPLANTNLANSSVTVGTTAISLGGSSTSLAGLTSVTSTSFVGALTGNADTVTNGVYTTGSYANPAWITSLAGSKISGNISNAGTIYSRGSFGMYSSSIAGNPLLYDVQDQGGNVVIEIGRTDGTSGTSVLDFHSGATAVDYDARMQAIGGNGTVGGGTFNFLSANFRHNSVDVVTISGTQTLTNKTLTSPTIGGSLTTFSDTTDATSSTVAPVEFAGGVGIAKKLFVGTDATVNGNLQIDGNLTVSGTTVTINATNLAVEDNMIYLNQGSAVANPDLGIAGNYNDGVYKHGGFFRDATDGYWKVFKDYTPEPDASAFIDTAHASFALADIQAANFRGALVGNAATATKLATARTINGTSFDGSANITVTATATNTLTIGTGLSGTSYNGSSAVTVALASAYGDTTNPYASKTANYVLAAPNGASGVPTFRALVAADVPTLNQNTTGTAGGLTGTPSISVGTISATGAITSTLASGTAPFSITSTTLNTNLNADMLDGNHASAFYLATNPSGYTTNTGTVTSVSMTVPTGLSVSGSPITTSGTLALSLSAGYSIPTTASQTNWDTAYTDRNKWDGGSTGLVAATGRTSLGATTVGGNLFTLTNPSAITFPRFNADNTVSALDAATFRTAIGAGTSSTTGTVTSVGGTGTVSGLTLTGTVTTSGNLTLGGTLAVTASNFASQTANTFLAAPNGAAGVPTFRALVAADVPTLNQNTTGSSGSCTGNAATATTATTANALNTANNYQVNSLGVGTPASGTAGEIRATNNVTAYYSDDRLKTKFGNIENALDKLLTLNGFYYEANETAQELGYKPVREVGVSAQQVQAIMPEVVAPAPIDDKYLTVRYERLVPLLIEAIKEQQKQIDELKSMLGK